MKSAVASLGGLLVAVALTTLGCALSSDNPRPNSDTVSYFKALSEQGMGAAQAMAGASNLESVKGALLDAKSGEALEYEKYFRSRVASGNSSTREIADNADEAHRLFQEAMSEMLMSWVDSNEAHITDGSRTLNRSIALANATMTKINAQR